MGEEASITLEEQILLLGDDISIKPTALKQFISVSSKHLPELKTCGHDMQCSQYFWSNLNSKQYYKCLLWNNN